MTPIDRLNRACPTFAPTGLWACRTCGGLFRVDDGQVRSPGLPRDHAIGLCSRACAEYHLDPAFVAELYGEEGIR